MRRFLVAVSFLIAAAVAVPCFGAVSPLMSFQGVARDAGGNVVADGLYPFHFRIYDDSTGGTLVWEEQQDVVVTNGLFSVLLGAANQLVDTVFQDAVWLEVEFSGSILSRIPITSAGYSFRVSTIDGSTGGVVTGSVDFGAGHNSLGTDHFVAGNTHVLTGEYSAITGGLNDTVGADYAFIGGGTGNAATGLYSSIGGGLQNQALGEAAAVAGGEYNWAKQYQSFVGGGRYNQAGGHAAVCGGLGNNADGEQSFVGGGHENTAGAIGAAVGGGFWNGARGEYSVVCGGGGFVREDSNSALGNYSFVGAGNSNLATAPYSAVLAGRFNIASGARAVVCGGGGAGLESNVASGASSFVGAGFNNKARGDLSVVCGGGYAGIGDTNVAAGDASFIGAGRGNFVGGDYSAVPGGYYNYATGHYSFAAGSNAKARHSYSFVWGDGYAWADSVSSDAHHQFKIRAANGIRFASEAGNSQVIAMGDHYRDNGIIAWARISAAGSMGTTEFGVASCAPSGLAGAYLITLDATAASAAQLIATATPEVSAQPVSATSLRIASIRQATANSFYVYINNGAGTAVDNDFVFTVTGR